MGSPLFFKRNGRDVILDDELFAACRALDAEAARREKRAAIWRGLIHVDLRTHPDLQEAWEKAFDAASERLERRPPLQVQVGDFVRINGFRFRISSVNPAYRTVSTERLDARGKCVSGVSCDGVGLVPETPAEAGQPDRNDELDPPPTMTSGADRSRYVLDAHKWALGDTLIE